MKQELSQRDSLPNFQTARNKQEDLEACVFMTLVFLCTPPHHQSLTFTQGIDQQFSEIRV